jgi:hypothetical protein
LYISDGRLIFRRRHRLNRGVLRHHPFHRPLPHAQIPRPPAGPAILPRRPQCPLVGCGLLLVCLQHRQRALRGFGGKRR